MTDKDFEIVKRMYDDILGICAEHPSCSTCEFQHKDVYGNKVTCLGYEINLIYHKACKEKPGRVKVK